jgi:ELWxxDGT repeat protein
MFEIFQAIGSAVLYLKAGAVLDAEANPVLNVNVEIDDPNFGSGPDDLDKLSINVTAPLSDDSILYFHADSGEVGGEGIWGLKTDGSFFTPNNTRTGNSPSLPIIYTAGTNLYFTTGVSFDEWLYQIFPDDSRVELLNARDNLRIVPFNERLVIYGQDRLGEGNDYHFWQVDGAGQLSEVAGFASSGLDYVGINSFNTHVFNNHLYFIGTDVGGTYGEEWWRMDSEGNFALAADINTGPEGSNAGHPIIFNNASYFEAETTAAGSALWRINSDNSHEMVTDLNPGTDFGALPLIVQGDTLVIYGDDGTNNGTGLWRLDTSDNLTRIPGTEGMSSVDLEDVFVFDGDLFLRFIRLNPSEGHFFRIKPDNTIIPVIAPGENPYLLDIDYHASLDGTLYFAANNGDVGRELFRLNEDGTVTTLTNHLAPGDDLFFGKAGSEPQDLTVFGNKLIFSASSESTGMELYQVTNGGEVEIVTDLYPGSNSSNPYELTVLDPTP